MDNADLSQLSDYAVEVFYQFFFKGNQIIKSFFYLIGRHMGHFYAK